MADDIALSFGVPSLNKCDRFTAREHEGRGSEREGPRQDLTNLLTKAVFVW